MKVTCSKVKRLRQGGGSSNSPTVTSKVTAFRWQPKDLSDIKGI